MNSIAFAYFTNNHFIGWYADSFGSIRSTPKLYPNLPNQIEVIKDNFNRKVRLINESSYHEQKSKARGLLDAIRLANYDGEDKIKGKQVELRVVITPFYQGPNEKFNKDKPHHPIHNPSWIYANDNLVAEWAKNEPKEFIKIIKTEPENQDN